MALGSLAGIVHRLRAAQPSDTAPDADLLERFLAARDGAAFERLVRRHGPMVLAVCRRVLRNNHDAEDAFQATFLVLAHKAGSVSPRSRLASWLHGVAHRVALKARHRAARRAEIESRAPARSTDAMPPTDPDADALEPLLDQELAALPERYRLPIVMCDLEGRPRADVAKQLNCAEGTLSSRLTRGRRLLAERLTRRGVRASAGAVAVVLAGRAPAVAEPLIRDTVPAALGAASPTVAALATGVLKGLFFQKLQAVALAALVVAGTALGLTVLVSDRSEAAPVPKAPAGADEKAQLEALADVEGQLLMNRKVLKDMRCDFDQFDKIMDTLEAAQQKAQKVQNDAIIQLKVNPNGGNFAPEQFEKMLKDAQAAGEKEFRKSVAGVVADVLTGPQRKRLREIDLQYRGHEALSSPSIAKVLDLSAKQKEQLAECAKQVQESVNNAFQKPVAGIGPDGAVAFDFEKVIRDARAEGAKKALAVLTDDQKATWKAMTGEPCKNLPNRAWHGHNGVFFGGGGFGGFGRATAPAIDLPLPAPVPAPAPVPEK